MANAQDYVIRLSTQDADTVRRALEQIGERGDAAFERIKKAAEQAKAGIEGIGKAGAGDFAKRAADIEAYGRELDGLRAKYNPLFAAQQKYRAELAEVNRALKVGAINQHEYAAALARTKAGFAAQVTGMKQVTAAHNLSSQAIAAGSKSAQRLGGVLQQTGYQVGDFAVQIASGQNAVVAFTQQGSQMLGAFGPWGAVIGAAGAVVGALAVAFWDTDDAAKGAADAIEQYEDAIEQAEAFAKRLNDATKTSAQLLREERAEILANVSAKVTAAQAQLDLLLAQAAAVNAITQDPSADPMFESFVDYTAINQQAEALAKVKAEFDKIRQSIDDAIKSKESFESDEAREKIETYVETLELENEQLVRLEEAHREGASALQTVQDLIAVENALREQGIDLKSKEGRQIAELVLHNRDLERAIKATTDAQKDAERAAEDAAREQQRAAEQTARELNRVADNIADDWSETLYDSIVLEDRKFDIVQSFKDLFRRIAIEAIKAQIVLPIATRVVGSAPALFGGSGGGTGGQVANIAGQIAGGGGGGGFGYGGDALSMGSSLFSGATWTTGSAAMGNTFASVGNWLGGAETAATFGNAGLNLSSLSGMAGGFVGNLGANLLLGDRGMAANIGGTLGAIAGSFIPIPSVGTAIGAFLGNAIGGLFGSKKKDPYGRVVVEPRGEKGFGYTSITEGGYPSKATGEIGKALVGLFRKVGETLDLEIDTYSGGQYGVYVQGKSESEIRDKMFLQLRRGLLNGLYEDVPKALRRALMDMEDAPTEASVTRVLDDFLRTKEGLVAALEEMSKAAEKAQSPFTAMIDNFKAQMKALKEGVADFGLDPAQVTAAERNQLGIIRDNVNETLRRELLGLTDPKALALEQWAEWAIALRRDVKTIGGDLVTAERLIAEKRLQVLEQYGERMVDEQRRTAAQQLAAARSLREWLDAQVLGDLSSLSPTDKLAEAQRQFDTIVASARGGDEAAFERVTGQASALLEAAQAVFGSTRGFVEIEERVRAAIAGLGRSLDLPGFAAGGLVTGGTPGRDSVPALLMPGERVFSVPHSRLLERLAANANDSGETVAELRRVTATLEATAQRAAGQAAAENRALRAAIARLETRLEELEAPLRRAVAR